MYSETTSRVSWSRSLLATSTGRTLAIEAAPGSRASSVLAALVLPAGLVALAALGGCHRPGADTDLAVAQSSPFRSRFARDEAWLRRAAAADPTMRERARLAEAALAPYRRDDEVAGIWIERGGQAPRTLALGDVATPPERLRWVALRTDRDSDLEVGLSVGGLAESSEDGEAIVYLRRQAAGSDGVPLTVTVGYSPAGHDEPRAAVAP